MKKGAEKNPEVKTLTLEKALIENFISLQKVMANLSSRFDNLSEQITKLLEVFEISAKALAEKDFEKFQSSDNKELLEKLDRVLEQNKTIARGMTLMHEKNFESPFEENPSPGFQGYRPTNPQNKFKHLPKY